jgi:hypothetical protein
MNTEEMPVRAHRSVDAGHNEAAVLQDADQHVRCRHRSGTEAVPIPQVGTGTERRSIVYFTDAVSSADVRAVIDLGTPQASS